MSLLILVPDLPPNPTWRNVALYFSIIEANKA